MDNNSNKGAISKASLQLAGVVLFIAINPLIFWFLVKQFGVTAPLYTYYAAEFLLMWMIANVAVLFTIFSKSPEPPEPIRHI